MGRQSRTFYSLRHTHISMRLLEGADIYQIAKNCRTSVEMIEKFYASHIKDMIDAAAINVRKAPVDKATKPRASKAKTPKVSAETQGAIAAADNINIVLGGESASLYRLRRLRGRGGIGRRNGLRPLSARGETRDAELLKLGETFYLAIPSQAPRRKSRGRCRD